MFCKLKFQILEIASISVYLLAISMKSEFDLSNLKSTEKMPEETKERGLQHS